MKLVPQIYFYQFNLKVTSFPMTIIVLQLQSQLESYDRSKFEKKIQQEPTSLTFQLLYFRSMILLGSLLIYTFGSLTDGSLRLSLLVYIQTWPLSTSLITFFLRILYVRTIARRLIDLLTQIDNWDLDEWRKHQPMEYFFELYSNSIKLVS